jgi:hypothetical protein
MSMTEAEKFFGAGEAKTPAAHAILGRLADVEQLLGLLDRLVDSGKSVIVIAHHQAVMAHADSIIDLGPGAGPRRRPDRLRGHARRARRRPLHPHRRAPRGLRRHLTEALRAGSRNRVVPGRFLLMAVPPATGSVRFGRAGETTARSFKSKSFIPNERGVTLEPQPLTWSIGLRPRASRTRGRDDSLAPGTGEGTGWCRNTGRRLGRAGLMRRRGISGSRSCRCNCG